jgi:hypothetical protein
MTPKTIVEDLDIFKDVQSGLGPGGILLMKDQLSFEGAEETFDRSIVITVTLCGSYYALVNKVWYSSLAYWLP